ncbi:MAG: LPS export ABC transporter periplasmic protein LptC [Pseudomonadota bacterium]
MTTRASANRYSTLVAWVKIILPLVALGVLSTLFLFSGRPDPEAALSAAGIDVTDLAAQQRLGRPRFAGTLGDGRALVFSAERAAPVADATDLFTAEDVAARLTLEPGLEALIDAAGAFVDMAAGRAELSGGVDVMRTDGVRLSTETLELNLAELGAVAPSAVSVTAPGLTIEAGGMSLTAEGRVHFSGGVRVVYDPTRPEP